jgi:Fe-S-cluster-containing dehydrogenase component
MTISAEDYFRGWRSDRKKEPRYLAVIDKDSCTSCNACATIFQDYERVFLD